MSDLNTNVLYYGADATVILDVTVILSAAKNLAEPRGICHV